MLQSARRHSARPASSRKDTVRSWLFRLGNRQVALPAFIFKFDVLDSHGCRIGVQIWHCLVLGYPTAVYLVRKNLLSCLIENINENVFAEVSKRTLGTSTELPHPACPVFKGEVMCQAAFQRDLLECCSSGGLSFDTRRAALPWLNRFCCL